MSMLSPKKILLIQKSLPFMAKGLLMTIQIAVIAILIGMVFGTIFGILNARRMKNRLFSWIFDGYILIIRGTPLYVQILIAYFALPDLLGISLSPFTAGVLALGANSIAYVGEIIRGGVNSIPSGQWDAAYVLGYSRYQTLVAIILPQTIRNVLPSLTNELVVLVKETSLLSSIGLVELTRISRDIIARELDPMTIYLAAALLYLVVTTALSLVAKRLEKGLAYD